MLHRVGTDACGYLRRRPIRGLPELTTNLVAGDTNGSPDAFVRDLQLGTTERVSVNSAGVQGNSYNFYGCSISDDGR